MAEWYRDPTGAFAAGFWTHEGGTIEVDYTEHEFCLLLAGKVRLTDQEGNVDVYGMGDGFVIPAVCGPRVEEIIGAARAVIRSSARRRTRNAARPRPSCRACIDRVPQRQHLPHTSAILIPKGSRTPPGTTQTPFAKG
jgi:hypothetical protein